jgi:Uma2 family endonuclease
MGSAVQIPVDAYLRTNYRPDREYIDGEIRERNVGKWEHARVQALLAIWFGSHESEWQILTATEQRVRVSGSRIRIPDVVVVRAEDQPDVLTEPPLLVVEILSPDDTYSDTQERAEDYLRMGVATVWIIDPKTRSAKMCASQAWVAGLRLEVPGSPVYVDLQEIFAKLGPSGR